MPNRLATETSPYLQLAVSPLAAIGNELVLFGGQNASGASRAVVVGARGRNLARNA